MMKLKLYFHAMHEIENNKMVGEYCQTIAMFYKYCQNIAMKIQQRLKETAK